MGYSGYNYNNSILYIFRFDDVCINSDMTLTNSIAKYIQGKFGENARILYGISPLVHDNCGERVYPKIFNAYSGYTNFYKVDRAGIPTIPDFVYTAGHGIIHVDHRSLNKQAQEISILSSCSLVGSKVFIPPFNKWNKDTEDVCDEHGILLVKFECGWRSLEHNSYEKIHNSWYLHAREWTLDKIKKWFGE